MTDTESTLGSKALNVNAPASRSSNSIYEAGRNEEKQDTEEVALSDGFRDPDDDNTMIDRQRAIPVRTLYCLQYGAGRCKIPSSP